MEGVSPEWEDPQNTGGLIYSMQYEIRKDLGEFLDNIKDFWLKLMLFLIGESLPCANLVRENYLS